jgi:hypothetical protein
VIRLAFVPSVEGYTITAEFPEHQIQSQPVPVPRPSGYDLYALARLEGINFSISPREDQEYYIPPDQAVSWRWSLTPLAPGSQRLNIILQLRWDPAAGTVGLSRQVLAYSRSLDVRVQSFFGLTRGQAMTGGFFGLLLGGGMCLFGLVTLVQPARPALQTMRENPGLVIEPRPGLALASTEQSLLRTLFRRYGRLVLESEFLSGYSGARTFLALPLRPDGRADAYTIVKISQKSSIQREFENYETFVKDTLPPMTARIQHAPVTVHGSSYAALQYTFIAEPGRWPISLSQALLEQPNPALLDKLFETFGPNWWMQRHPWVFRLAEEYDRVLPAHLVLEPARGQGTLLDGRSAPAELQLSIGQMVNLRFFTGLERRADGNSFSLYGIPPPGQPALRVRWLSPTPPDGASGRVVATRQTLLQELVRGFDLYGLPDPLERLPDLMNEQINGTRSTIHGDLNLENVLVGPGDFVWLIDFATIRSGHPLFDFAHLETEILAHILAPRLEQPQAIIPLLEDIVVGPHDLQTIVEGSNLLPALHQIALRCLFNPSRPREYALALYMTCVGALKYSNLEPVQKQVLYLAAASLARNL